VALARRRVKGGTSRVPSDVADRRARGKRARLLVMWPGARAPIWVTWRPKSEVWMEVRKEGMGDTRRIVATCLYCRGRLKKGGRGVLDVETRGGDDLRRVQSFRRLNLGNSVARGWGIHVASLQRVRNVVGGRQREGKWAEGGWADFDGA